MTGRPQPPKRHSGEMYDAVWELPASALVIEGVKPGTARHVLHAAARLTNPTRDWGRFEWWADAEKIAEAAEVHVRTVERVFSTLLERGWIEIIEPGVRNGRPRRGESGRRGVRSPRYRACLDEWPVDPERTLKNSRDVHVVTSDSRVVGADSADARVVTNGIVTTPASSASEIAATPASPKPGKGLTRKSGVEPTTEPARENARTNQSDDLQPRLMPVVPVAVRREGEGELRERWGRVLERLRLTTSSAHFDVYLANTKALGWDQRQAVLFVEVQNQFDVPWLEGKLANQIYTAVAEEFRGPVRAEYRAAAESAAPR